MWEIWKEGVKQRKKEINNNDLKLNVDVDEQQDDITHLKEHLKGKALCVACNPSIAATKKWLKNVSKKPRKAFLKLLWSNVKVKKGSKQSYI